MSISDEINIGRVEKLANSLVLGTNAARLVGSSPTRRTIRENSGMNIHMSVFLDILRCVTCCVNKFINNKGKEKLARNRNSSSRTILRKLCQLLRFVRTSKNYLIQTLFLSKSTNRCIYTSAGVYATYATYPTQHDRCVDKSEHNRKKQCKNNNNNQNYYKNKSVNS